MQKSYPAGAKPTGEHRKLLESRPRSERAEPDLEEIVNAIGNSREPRPLAPEVDDVNVESSSVQPAGELDHLSLSAAELETVHRESNSRSIVFHDALDQAASQCRFR
jgi:hypothetical protein